MTTRKTTKRRSAAAATEAAAAAEAAIMGTFLSEMATHESPIEVVLRPTSAFQLASLLQLALRHPGLRADGDVTRTARTFIEHVRAYFADAPAISRVLAQGDDPAHDIPWRTM